MSHRFAAAFRHYPAAVGASLCAVAMQYVLKTEEAKPVPAMPGTLRPKSRVSPVDHAYQVLVCASLGTVSKFIMQVLNHTTCIDVDKLTSVLDDKHRQRVRGAVLRRWVAEPRVFMRL